MYKIFSIIILTTLLILNSAGTGLTAWQINLDVSTPDINSDTGTATNRLTAGTDQTATDTYDNKFDTVALLKGPIQAYLAHPEYATEQQKLWRDLRSDTHPKEWTIEINSPGDGNTINIKWEINAPDNLNFTLVDQDNNQEIGMRTSSEYSYNSISNVQKKFLLRVSENTVVNTGGGVNSNTAISNTGDAIKGGGCGYIKNVGGDGGYPGGSGSAALNTVIMLTPLIWFSIRRVVFSSVMIYVIKERKGTHIRHYGENTYPWSNLPVSLIADDFDTKQLWKWWRGGQQYPERRSWHSYTVLGGTNNKCGWNTIGCSGWV